ncbi:HAD family hydrolase [Crassaminicella indica]|uniref:HAD hydrolase-like protein n=1 Tax=Crassaminicella indica TaxID=2855394 RepID=A0ABX8R8Z3_9CLOT|nr:HAD family hydrolase [Crassaminicella indica]QXM05528.1 HAD hydrolase-like protein [Crassaminicella indica]
MKDILIVWDIDGTLINSKGCGRAAMEKAFYQLFGLEKAFKEVNMAGRLDAMIVNDAFDKNNIINRDIDLFFDIYCKVLEEMLIDKDYIKILPGVKAILEHNSQEYNIFHALGTGNIEKGARIKLKPHNLNKYFKVGAFGDEAIERWEMVHKAIQRAQAFNGIIYNRENIYVIGDTKLDIECAKILGIKSIAVATGAHSAELLREYAPDYLLESLEDKNKFLGIFG